MVQVEMMQLEVDALQAEAGSAYQAAKAGQTAFSTDEHRVTHLVTFCRQQSLHYRSR